MDSIGSGSGSISSESRRGPQTGESVEKDILDDSRDDFDDSQSSSKRRKGKENSIAIPRPISCPFCDRVLGGFLQGRRHVKFCGRKLKIDSTVVDEAVENLKESFAASDDDLGAKKPKKTTKTKRYQPQRGMDDETLIVLGVSASLAGDSRKPRKKVKQRLGDVDEIPELLLRSERQTNEMMAIKMGEIISTTEEESEIDSTPALAPSEMAQRFKPVDLTSEDDEEEVTTEIECRQSQFAANGNVTATSFLDKPRIDFWDLTTDGVDRASLNHFYVNGLIEIPSSEFKEASPHQEEEEDACISDDASIGIVPSQGFFDKKSTEEEEDVMSSKSPHQEDDASMGILPSQGFFDKKLTEEEDDDVMSSKTASIIGVEDREEDGIENTEVVSLVNKLLDDFASLVNSSRNSDVSIIGKDGRSIFAHRAILAARSPALEEIVRTSSNRLVINEANSDDILTVLRFIYTAKCLVTKESASNVHKLAQRWKLPDLVAACLSVDSRLNEPIWIREDDERERSYELIPLSDSLLAKSPISTLDDSELPPAFPCQSQQEKNKNSEDAFPISDVDDALFWSCDDGNDCATTAPTSAPSPESHFVPKNGVGSALTPVQPSRPKKKRRNLGATPDFDGMETPELWGEAKRFGLKKQLGKGKARKLLVNIHRYQRDGESDSQTENNA